VTVSSIERPVPLRATKSTKRRSTKETVAASLRNLRPINRCQWPMRRRSSYHALPSLNGQRNRPLWNTQTSSSIRERSPAAQQPRLQKNANNGRNIETAATPPIRRRNTSDMAKRNDGSHTTEPLKSPDNKCAELSCRPITATELGSFRLLSLSVECTVIPTYVCTLHLRIVRCATSYSLTKRFYRNQNNFKVCHLSFCTVRRMIPGSVPVIAIDKSSVFG
jgi:hypothetical protein